jgi:NodT family efflux transporter outer membrane factor (OMF) lipoprotein
MSSGKSMKSKNFTQAVVVILLAGTVLAGCSFMPEHQRPAVATAEAFSAPGAPDAIQADQIAADWWKTFRSDELNGLMERALENNNDIRAATARIEQARAQLKIAGASLLPAADLNANAGRSRNNPVTGATRTETSIGAGAAVAYEVDLFGRVRANVEGARADLRATTYDRAAINLLVMGEVARTYFILVNGYERLAIANDTISNSRQLLNIVEERLAAGASSQLEVAQQRSAVATTEAARASIIEGIANAENALAVLVGAPAQTVKAQRKTLTGLTIPAIATGQPSRLLERRPDIRRAEEQLISADANIAIARAAFFPTLNIGLDASILTTGLGDPVSTAFGIAAGLAAPIFQGGRLEGGVELATAVQRELVENYRKTVLVSFQEVEDALAATKASADRERAFGTAARESTRAYQLSRELFDAGAYDFQALLDAQRDELSARDSFSQSRSQRLIAAVDLYLALGGGWSSKPAK